MKSSITMKETFYTEEEALACQERHKGAEITFREGHGIMLNGEWTYEIPENRPSWTVSWDDPGTATKSDSIEFDSTDLAGMRQLMDEHGDSEFPFGGVNEDGEQVSISIAKDRIDVVTYQHNGWIRRNVYWRDGTREELFEGKWR